MNLWMIAIIGATLFVAYANGANDNFKGVATLFGSGAADYRKALTLATATTLSGSLTAVFLATRLVETFTGKGLVPDFVIGNPAFLAAVALGAGLTVFLAARLGIPISTTHGLTGALAGAGFVAIGKELGLGTLGKNFFLPLLASPFMAVALTMAIYFVLHRARRTFGITRTNCVCVGAKVSPLPVSSPNAAEQHCGKAACVLIGDSGRWIPAFAGMTSTQLKVKIPEVFVGNEGSCKARAIEAYEGKIFGVSVQSVLDFLHFVSAGAVSFARGLNDTPKILALLLASSAFGLRWNIFLVAIVMAVGGILSARRVAQTLSHRITSMNHGQGFTANFVTALLVMFASQWGMPVSTTHVSCGAIFGIGLVNGKAQWNVVSSILTAWFLTLPAAALLSAGCYFLLAQGGV